MEDKNTVLKVVESRSILYSGKIFSCVLCKIHLFSINNQKSKELPRKCLICQTISKQFAGANKRGKLNNPLGEQANPFSTYSRVPNNRRGWNNRRGGGVGHCNNY